MASGIFSFQDRKDRIAKTFLSNEIRYQSQNMAVIRNLARPEPKFGAHKGQDVAIEKYLKLSKQTAPLSELVSMPLQTVSVNEVTITVDEYGNGIANTRKAETLSQYALNPTLRRQLSTNQVETVDQIVFDKIDALIDVLYTPTGTTSSPTNNIDKGVTTPTAAATRNIQMFDFRKLRATLRNDNVPMFDNQSYLAILEPFGVEAVFADVQTGGLTDLLKYTAPEMLLRGEFTRSVYGFRFLEETNVLPDTLGTTNFAGAGWVLGFDAIGEALVEPERVESDMWNFNRFSGIAWVLLSGWTLIWRNASDTEYRAIKITST